MVEQTSSHCCPTVFMSACKCLDSPYRPAAHKQGGPDAYSQSRGQQSGQTQESDSSQQSRSSGSTSSTASSELSDPDATLRFLRRSYGGARPPVTANAILAVSAGMSSICSCELRNTCLSARQVALDCNSAVSYLPASQRVPNAVCNPYTPCNPLAMIVTG